MRCSAAIVLLSLCLAACGSKTAPPAEVAATPTAVVAVASPSPAEALAREPLTEEPAAQEQQAESSFDPRTPEIARRSTEMGLGLAQQRLSLCQYGYQMAQQMGNQEQMDLYQQEIQMHQAMIGEYQSWLSDPQAFADEASCRSALERMQEYDYRSNTRDMRPSDQIQEDLAKYVAYATWKAGTPEGQQAHQASMAAMKAQGDARTARHNQNMADMQAQADARNAAWSANQQSNYEQHQRNVHSIYNEYEYQDPTNGQRYWVPMENENPTVTNPDGTQTELEPYSE